MKSSFGEAGDDFSYSMDPVAVVKIDDYYRLAIKHTDTFNFDGESEVNIGIKAIKGGGNNVYVDDIDIRQGSATAFNHQYKNSKFLIYPNPLKDRLNIDGDYLYLEIYDLAGRLVFTTKKTDDIIYVTNIDNGTYMLNIYTKEECTVEKITINK